VSGGQWGNVHLWDWSASALRPPLGMSGFVYSVAARPDGGLLATSGHEGSVRLWDVTTTPPRCRLIRLHPTYHWVAGAAFSPEGRHLAATGHDGLIYLLRVPEALPEDGSGLVRTFGEHTGWVLAVAVSPDGTRGLSGSWDGTARLWDLGTGKE